MNFGTLNFGSSSFASVRSQLASASDAVRETGVASLISLSSTTSEDCLNASKLWAVVRFDKLMLMPGYAQRLAQGLRWRS